MTQEQKELLLKDICAKLPYGVKVSYRCHHIHILKGMHESGILVINDTFTNITTTTDVENIRPYLFPISSMTEEQQIIYGDMCYGVINSLACNMQAELNELIDWLNKNHFDIYGLIPMGLAIDATGKNIY